MRNLGFVGLAAVVAMWAAPANANLFTNGTFDTNASGWTISTGAGCNDAHWVSSPGNPGGSVQLNSCGEIGSNPTVAQTVSGLTPGDTYKIGWENRVHVPISANGASFGVAVNGVIIDLSENVTTTWIADSVNFKATGTSATILFAGEVDPTDVSYYVDNLSLALVSDGVGGVPEPATLALFGAGLAGLSALRRRRKAKS